MTSSLLLGLLLASIDAGPAPRPSLLRGATVSQAEGVPTVARMTDGTASTDGDAWDSPRAAVLGATRAVTWDLGRPEPLAHLRLQADNNDVYVLQGSLDGASWFPVWEAGPVELPGVQTRTSPPLATQLRYLRLTARGGDGMYSVGELEAFDTPEALAAAQLKRVTPPPPPPPAPPPPFNSAFLVVQGVAAVVAGFFAWARHRNRSRRAP